MAPSKDTNELKDASTNSTTSNTEIDSSKPVAVDEGNPESAEAELAAATELPDSGETSEGGKLKMIVQLLKRCLGVKDLAAMYVHSPFSKPISPFGMRRRLLT